MWGAAILHAARIRNLIVRRGEENCPAELMRGIKPKLPISKLSIFGSTVFMGKREREREKSANLNPRHWMESLWVTLKEKTETWCTYPTHAR